MEALREELDALATRERFAGVVRVDLPEDRGFAAAYGLADRRCGVDNTVGTRFAIASGAKAFTALTVMRQVEEGRLTLATPARSVLGDDLPLIDERVTVQHLLEHSSGIGDYFDEDAADEITDYPLTVPVHTLATTEDYLAALDGFPQLFAPGERVKYCNGAYVVLALIAGRVSGTPFHELVETEVCGPAGLSDTAFLRSDELPAGTATGYLDVDGMRTNVLHLPVRGSGDGGIYSTAADIATLWTALMGAGIVRAETLATMTAAALAVGRRGRPLRVGDLDRRRVRGTHVRGVRRRGVVLHQPRPRPRLDVHGPLEHLGGCLADRDVPAREAGPGALGRSAGVAPRSRQRAVGT